MTWENELERKIESWKKNNYTENQIRKASILYLEQMEASLPADQKEKATQKRMSLSITLGKNLKEHYEDFIEARKYFNRVLQSNQSQFHAQAKYHLAHVSSAFGDDEEAIDWFEQAIKESSDPKLIIKAYYFAAIHLINVQQHEKAKKFVETGRKLDTRYAFQNEYEIVKNKLSRSTLGSSGQQGYELDLQVYEPIHISEEEFKKMRNGKSHEIDRLANIDRFCFLCQCPDSAYNLHLFYESKQIKIREDFAEMFILLSRGAVESDRYWLDEVFVDIRSIESLEQTIHRINHKFEAHGMPFKIRRRENQFWWDGPPIYSLTQLDEEDY